MVSPQKYIIICFLKILIIVIITFMKCYNKPSNLHNVSINGMYNITQYYKNVLLMVHIIVNYL